MYLYRLCITHHVAVTKPEAGYAGGTASTGHLALSTTHIAAAAAEDTISDVTSAALLLLRMRRLAFHFYLRSCIDSGVPSAGRSVWSARHEILTTGATRSTRHQQTQLVTRQAVAVVAHARLLQARRHHLHLKKLRQTLQQDSRRIGVQVQANNPPLHKFRVEQLSLVQREAVGTRGEVFVRGDNTATPLHHKASLGRFAAAAVAILSAL